MLQEMLTLSYWFYPNPGNADLGNPKAAILLVVCALLFGGSFFVNRWRKGSDNPQTKKLTKSWVSVMRWMAGIGLVLIISRVEEIQFLAMRFLWVVWFVALAGFFGLQLWLFRKKHYTVVKQEKVEDPREKYLPKKG